MTTRRIPDGGSIPSEVNHFLANRQILATGFESTITTKTNWFIFPPRPYGPMDKAPAYGAGDSGFESQYGLHFFAKNRG